MSQLTQSWLNATPAITTYGFNATVSPPLTVPSNNLQATMKWVNIGVSTFGLLGNLFVVLVVLGVRKLRQKPRNWFLLNQSLADFFSAVFIIALATRTVPKTFWVTMVSI